jgi:hypothetical protein
MDFEKILRDAKPNDADYKFAVDIVACMVTLEDEALRVAFMAKVLAGIREGLTAKMKEDPLFKALSLMAQM